MSKETTFNIKFTTKHYIKSDDELDFNAQVKAIIDGLRNGEKAIVVKKVIGTVTVMKVS